MTRYSRRLARAVDNGDDRKLLRRIARASAWQTAVALALTLVVIGAVVYVLEVRAQAHEIDGQLALVMRTVDDVDDPPPGMALAIKNSRGEADISRNAPSIATALLAAPVGYSSVREGDTDYRALVVERPGERVVALLDEGPWRQDRVRLLEALGAAEIAGAICAVAVSLLLSRRAIGPLARALAAQRRFVADASHELRAPLTVLHTRAQLLARRATESDVDPAFRRGLHDLVDDTQMLGEVVEDLLTAAAWADADRQHHEPVDAVSLLEQIRASVADHADSLGIELSVAAATPGDLPLNIDGKRSALRRAVLALVDNSLSHCECGDEIVLAARRAGSMVLISVRDTGRGVDPEIADNLFGRFVHGDGHSTGKRHYGLGLALVREIVDAHRGRVSVTSKTNGGSTFTMELPAAPNVERPSQELS